MFKGGPVYTRLAARMVRFAELLNPIILFTYGFLISKGIIYSSFKVNVVGLYILMSIWMIVGLWAFFVPTKQRIGLIVRNVMYHLLFGAYLIFVVGLSSFIAGGLVALTLSAYVLSPKKGALLSNALLVVIALLDVFIFNSSNPTILLSDLFTVIVVLSVGSTCVSIFQTQKVSQDAINTSKTNESLQRDRILAIVNNLADAVLSIDIEGVIRIYNAASLNLLDTNSSLSGRHIDELLPLTNQKNESVSLFKEIQLSKSVVRREDLNYRFGDGEKIRLEITYAPIRSTNSRLAKGEVRDGYVVIMRDITKVKSLEEEHDEFISVTSHELRTPITIAEGTISNVQVMLEHPDITKEMLKDAVKTAHEQIIYLANMVNDLTTLSRAERDAADKAEDIDVTELAHNLHDKYVADAKAKRLHLDLDLSPKLDFVYASRLYLEELLQDFMTNAIKYTQKGNITIIFSQRHGKITFAVKDTGIGISRTDQSKIFNKFYRSEDYRTRETSGTGLGLYIATKLSQKLGTQIRLTSRLNFGSTFSFSLPVKSDDNKLAS